MKSLVLLVGSFTGLSGLGTWGVTWGSTKDDGLHWLRKFYRTIKDKSKGNGALAVKLNPITFSKKSNDDEELNDFDIFIDEKCKSYTDNKLKINYLKQMKDVEFCKVIAYKDKSNKGDPWISFDFKHKPTSIISTLAKILTNKHLKDDKDTNYKDEFLNHLKNCLDKWNENSYKNEKNFWFIIEDKNNTKSLIRDKEEVKKLLKSPDNLGNSDNVVELQELNHMVEKLKRFSKDSSKRADFFKEMKSNIERENYTVTYVNFKK